MNFNEYQKFTCSTKIYPKDQAIYYTLLGLAGESGEICEKVKKIIRDKKKKISKEKLSFEEKEELIKEVGDVIWYCSTLADELGYTLEEVVKKNIDKLSSRQKRNKVKGSGDNR